MEVRGGDYKTAQVNVQNSLKSWFSLEIIAMQLAVLKPKFSLETRPLFSNHRT